jgi:sulfur-carrier protein
MIPMKIQLKLFASLREITGVEFEQIELPDQVRTLADVRAHLQGRSPVWAQALSEKKAIRGAINQRMVSEQDLVRDGDEVAFFPPVTGG